MYYELILAVGRMTKCTEEISSCFYMKHEVSKNYKATGFKNLKRTSDEIELHLH